jgi:hypothetical protein
MDQCFFLGMYKLPGGTCAQWFSGTASALAVATALLGYAFNEWRHRKENKHREEEDAAGIGFLLGRALDEAVAVHYLLSTGFQKFEIAGENFEIDDSMSGVSFSVIEDLDKSQLRFLASYGCSYLMRELSFAILTVNQTNRALEDYAAEVERFYECVRRDDPGNVPTNVDISRVDFQSDTIRLAHICSQSRAHLKMEAEKCLFLVTETIEKFNTFLDEKFKSKIALKIALDVPQESP